MTDKQRARLTMMQATLAVLDQYAEVYAANKALGTARAELAALVQDLDPTAETQQGAAAPRSAGAVKKATKLHLAQRAAEVAAALLAYADEQQDIRLHTDADYSEYQLRRAPDNDLARISKNIHTQATAHLTALQEQGVTKQELTELDTALTAFQAEQTAPRAAIADGKAQTKALATDLRAAVALLRNRLDKYLVRYQRPEPRFYTAYQSARQTINTAQRREKPAPAI
ncbi:hypothetical protein [Hymenobacter sediminicola]|uniref:Uncharacterized protein n=1 Tax=Hymenobacter sediminicola TaxID=2761579 RepID=A0A7G7W8Q1_9BACT|nr:hypothetical protein [Hymenobacter sediminicola]QNH62744.1 hypothetical protein H4317_02660 [Hymenobacter sediminicola]